MKMLNGEKLQKRLECLEAMREYERMYEACSFTCGTDEAGHGPLAGPVVAGAMILSKDCRTLYLSNSRKVSEEKRELLFDEIRGKAVGYGIDVVEPGRIDEINIPQVTYEATRETVSQLQPAPRTLLSDAIIIPDISLMQTPIVKGDAKSVSTVVVSTLAKVIRDKMIVEYGTLHPEYGFVKHKGYGATVHIQVLKEHGPCSICRRSFVENFV